MSKLARLAATGGAPTYVEDVFSTYLYTGNGSTQTITNGIDLSGKGGLVWIKGRSNSASHTLTDTARGAGTGATTSKALCTDSTNGESQGGASLDYLSAFSATGFSVVQGGASSFLQGTNTNSVTYVSWTFRKQAKFFDVVTFTTGASGNYTFNHSLGVAPGMVIIKATDATSNWNVYHRSLGDNSRLFLEQTAAKNDFTGLWLNVTATTFGGNIGTTLEPSKTHVAYLFAHDAGGFGASGSDNVISCGSYTGAGASAVNVNLGYEPQYLLWKRTDSTSQWVIMDVLRGMTAAGSDQILYPNLSNAEANTSPTINPNATGFTVAASNSVYNASGATYIYIAIRRPNKPPTTGTSVFAPFAYSGDNNDGKQLGGYSFIPDMVFLHGRAGAASVAHPTFADRLRGYRKLLTTNNNGATNVPTSESEWDGNTGVTGLVVNVGHTAWNPTLGFQTFNGTGFTYIAEIFRRAPGFFDVVCYTGTGVARTVTHNLGVAPELMIVKNRSIGFSWGVYVSALGATKTLQLDGTLAAGNDPSQWNNTTPTSSVFTVGDSGATNRNGDSIVAYLFASLPGVSKVGTYTGNGGTVNTNGTAQTINCGFSSGARFVLIKRTDSTGDWYTFDTARGLVSGNDPYLLLNSTAAEVTTVDAVDPDNSGFVVNQTSGTNLNVTSATYIYLAIA